jgi:hypothetical protein
MTRKGGTMQKKPNRKEVNHIDFYCDDDLLKRIEEAQEVFGISMKELIWRGVMMYVTEMLDDKNRNVMSAVVDINRRMIPYPFDEDEIILEGQD